MSFYYHRHYWAIKSEPFDWFATEKSIDLPFFDNVPSPQQYYNPQKLQNNVQRFHNYAFQAANEIKNEPEMPNGEFSYDGALTGLRGPPLTLTSAAAPSPQHLFVYTSPVHTQSSVAQPTTSVAPGPISPMTSVPLPSMTTIPMPLPSPVSPVSPVPSIESAWVKAETLTPPDSPKDDEILKLLQEIETDEIGQLAMARKILQEIEPDELEQLVMTRVDDMTSTYSEKSCSMDDFSDCGGASSPSQGSDSGLDDPEWSPPRRMKSVSGYSSAASSSTASGTTSSRRKSKPYSRPPPEDRKIRKKEQNKNAATRYRMKKKAEVEEVRNEEKQLEDRNKELKDKLEDINREVKYLKSLMRDVYRKKGLIK
ncbi:activating transcription factor of chaperone isoform X2 [Planococcus citri]|uniref:activating transcription factor of chaperone isoform X2 n=1 Tax=Planococcus citri TaxID=170843 RepID=UPI0031F9086D